jgi:hypothetical protein
MKKAEPPFSFFPFGGHSTLWVGLKAYWSMDEDPARLDSVGSADLAEIVNVGSAAGKVGNCSAFGAAFPAPKLSLADATALVPSGDYSWAGWFKSASFTEANSWMKLRDDEGVQDLFVWKQLSLAGFASPPVPVFEHNDGSLKLVSCVPGTSGEMAPGVWSFVVVRFDASEQTLRIDVARESQSFPNGTGTISDVGDLTSPAGQPALNFETAIGKDYSADEVGLWHKRLSNAEALYLFNDGDGRTF